MNIMYKSYSLKFFATSFPMITCLLSSAWSVTVMRTLTFGGVMKGEGGGSDICWVSKLTEICL